MTAGLHALLAGAIDYAGLFPPARLPLQEAFGNYLRFRQSPEAWMLGRFVIPVSRLGELTGFEREIKSQTHPVAFALLGHPGETRETLLAEVADDVKAWTEFRGFFGESVNPGIVEFRLPDNAVDELLDDFLMDLVIALQNGPLVHWSLFVEPSDHATWRLSDAWVVGSLATINLVFRRPTAYFQTAGFKLRCAGKATPLPAARLAHALEQCRTNRIPLKLTAGLHHPFPFRDVNDDITMHGFINVLTAAVLIWSGSMPEAAVVELLEGGNPEQFDFTDDGLRWKDWNANLTDIREARRSLLVSFGSCSFDEPRDELRVLGWL